MDEDKSKVKSESLSAELFQNYDLEKCRILNEGVM